MLFTLPHAINFLTEKEKVLKCLMANLTCYLNYDFSKLFEEKSLCESSKDFDLYTFMLRLTS